MQLVSVISLPFWKREFFLSRAERSLYEILRRLAPDYTIFAKIRLCDVIFGFRTARTRQANRNRIQSKHLDFLICDATLTPVVAIELDDASHAGADHKECEQFVAAA